MMRASITRSLACSFRPQTPSVKKAAASNSPLLLRVTPTLSSVPWSQNPLLQRKPRPHPRRHQKQHALQGNKHDPHIPALALLLPIRVSQRIQHPADAPRRAQPGRRHGELQPRDQQRDEHARLVLDEVGVRPLRAVVHVKRLALGGRGVGELGLLGVGLRVFDAGAVAVGGDAEGEPGAKEGGAGGGEEDVAVEGKLGIFLDGRIDRSIFLRGFL